MADRGADTLGTETALGELSTRPSIKVFNKLKVLMGIESPSAIAAEIRVYDAWWKKAALNSQSSLKVCWFAVRLIGWCLRILPGKRYLIAPYASQLLD